MRNNSYRNNAKTNKNSLWQSHSSSRLLLLLPDTAAYWMMTTIIVVVVTFPTVIIYADAAATDDYGTNTNASLCLPDDCATVMGTGSFCGTDGQCHFYNCRDFLAYGPESFTGISTTTNDGNDATTSPAPPELICSSYVSSDIDGDGVYNGVIYGCMGYPDSIPDPNYGVNMPFNEKCSAQINERTTFDCWQYNNKEGSTIFDSFLSEASNANLSSCTATKDEDDDSSSPVVFIYESTYGYQNLTNGVTIATGANSTIDFNEDLATKNTMYSLLTVEETATPTAAPSIGEQPSSSTSTPTIDTSSSASSARHNNQMMVGNTMSTILLILAMKISYSLFIY